MLLSLSLFEEKIFIMVSCIYSSQTGHILLTFVICSFQLIGVLIGWSKIPCSARTLAWMIDLTSQSLLDATKEAAIQQL